MVHPKLRRLERVRMRRGQEDLVVLRDPLELADPVALDAAFEPLLDALDGQRSVAQIRQSLLMRGVLDVDRESLEDFVANLHEAGMLDDDRFRARWEQAHALFVDEEVRAPRRAGLLYPEHPDSLREWLAPALPVPEDPSDPSDAAAEHPGGYGDPARAVIVAHQPPVAIAGALRQLLTDLPDPARYRRVLILATDHAPGLLPYASADKDWATPLGTVGCDLATLAQLDQRLPWLLREQTRLRVSDPLEWATLVLRARWGERCPPVLALACGQTRLTTREGAERAKECVRVLRELLGDSIAAGETLCWTAAELFHLGPAYAQAELPTREAVAEQLDAVLAPLLEGRFQDLAATCMERPAAWRPSGAAALATLADLLPADARAQLLDPGILAAPGEAPGWIAAPTLRIT